MCPFLSHSASFLRIFKISNWKNTRFDEILLYSALQKIKYSNYSACNYGQACCPREGSPIRCLQHPLQECSPGRAGCPSQECYPGQACSPPEWISGRPRFPKGLLPILPDQKEDLDGPMAPFPLGKKPWMGLSLPGRQRWIDLLLSLIYCWMDLLPTGMKSWMNLSSQEWSPGWTFAHRNEALNGPFLTGMKRLMDLSSQEWSLGWIFSSQK